MRPDTLAARVNKLARAGTWVAMWASVALLFVSPGWTLELAASACTLAFAAIALVAGIIAVAPGRRWRGSRRKGGGLSGRGRDENDGPPGEVAHRWHALVMVSRLMPRSAGRRWLAEAGGSISGHSGVLLPPGRGPSPVVTGAAQVAVTLR